MSRSHCLVYPEESGYGEASSQTKMVCATNIAETDLDTRVENLEKAHGVDAAAMTGAQATQGSRRPGSGGD